jgi:hypothetical protein
VCENALGDILAAQYIMRSNIGNMGTNVKLKFIEKGKKPFYE